MSLIPIYFLTKKGEIKCKNISLEDLYRLYHWSKYPKNEEFVKKFIEDNGIQDNLFYTNLEELKQKCKEKGKVPSETPTKQKYQYTIKEITYGEIKKGKPTRYFYSIDMYGNIIKIIMSQETANKLTTSEMYEINKKYKLVYNATEKKNKAGKRCYQVITFSENINLDKIMEKATNMAMFKDNFIQDNEGQLKRINFPQNDLEENSIESRVFNVAKKYYCLRLLRAYKSGKRDDYINDDSFIRAYYIVYSKKIQKRDIERIINEEDYMEKINGMIEYNKDYLSQYGYMYNHKDNVVLEYNAKNKEKTAYINYKLEQLKNHLLYPEYYIDMYIPSKSSSASQTSTRSSTVQPQPQQQPLPKPEQRQSLSRGSVVKSATPSYDDSKTLCYDITKGEFSIKTYQEIKQDGNLRKVMFPDTKNTSKYTVFKPKEINTFNEAQNALRGTNKIHIEGFGQYVCNFESVNEYKLKGDNGYNILSIDINFINGTEKSEPKMECTKKTYCYYIKNDGKLCYDALTDEEMKQNYVLKVRIKNEQSEVINVPLDINSNTQKRLLLKSNTKNLHFSKSDVRGKACAVRFDNAINKLIFNIDETDYYFMNDNVGEATKFTPSVETEPKPQPLAIKPKSESEPQPKPLESSAEPKEEPEPTPTPKLKPEPEPEPKKEPDPEPEPLDLLGSSHTLQSTVIGQTAEQKEGPESKSLTAEPKQIYKKADETIMEEIFLKNYYLDQLIMIKDFFENRLITKEILEMYNNAARYLKETECEGIEDLKQKISSTDYEDKKRLVKNEYSQYDIYYDNYSLYSKENNADYYKILDQGRNESLKKVEIKINRDNLLSIETQYTRLFMCFCFLDYYNKIGKKNFFKYYENLIKENLTLYNFLYGYNGNEYPTEDTMYHVLQQSIGGIINKIKEYNGGKNLLNIDLTNYKNKKENFMRDMHKQLEMCKGKGGNYEKLYNMYTLVYENEVSQSSLTPQPQPEPLSLSNTSTISTSSPSAEPSKPSAEPSKPSTSSAEPKEEPEPTPEPEPETEPLKPSTPPAEPELKSESDSSSSSESEEDSASEPVSESSEPESEPKTEPKPSNPESTSSDSKDEERLPKYVLCYNLTAKRFNIYSKENINRKKNNYLICYKNNDKNEVCGGDTKEEVYNSIINKQIKLKNNSGNFIEYYCQGLGNTLGTTNMLIKYMDNQKSEYKETLISLVDKDVNVEVPTCYFSNEEKGIEKKCFVTPGETRYYQNTSSSDKYIWMFYEKDGGNYIGLFDFDKYDQEQECSPKIFSISTNNKGSKTINFFKCENGQLKKEKEQQLEDYPTLKNPGILTQEQPATTDYTEKPEPEPEPEPKKEPDPESEPKSTLYYGSSTLSSMATAMSRSQSNPDESVSAFPVSTTGPSSSSTPNPFSPLPKSIIQEEVSKFDEDLRKPSGTLSEDGDMYSYDSSTTTQPMLNPDSDMVKILALYNYKKSLENKLDIIARIRKINIRTLNEKSKEEDQIIFNYYTKVCEKADELLSEQLQKRGKDLRYVEEIEEQMLSNQALKQQVAQESKELGYTQALLKFDEQTQKYIQPILDYVILDMMKQSIRNGETVKENWPILPGCLDDVINFSDLDAKKQQEAIVAKQEELQKRIKINTDDLELMKTFAKQYFFGADSTEKSDEDLKQRYLAQDFYRHLDDLYYHTQEIQYPNEYIAQLFIERTNKKRYSEDNYDKTLQLILLSIRGIYPSINLSKLAKDSEFDIVKRDLFINMLINTVDDYKDTSEKKHTIKSHELREAILSINGSSFSRLLLLSSNHQTLCLTGGGFEDMYALIDEKKEEKEKINQLKIKIEALKTSLKTEQVELEALEKRLEEKKRKEGLKETDQKDLKKRQEYTQRIKQNLEESKKELQIKQENLKKEEKSKQEKEKLKKEYEQYYLKVQKELLSQYSEDTKFSEKLQGLKTADEIRIYLKTNLTNLQRNNYQANIKFINTLREYLLNDPVAKAGWFETYSQQKFGFEVKKCYGEIKPVGDANVEDCQDLIDDWNKAIDDMEENGNTKQPIETTLSKSYALYRHIVNGDLYFPKEKEYKKFLENRKKVVHCYIVLVQKKWL